MNKKKLEGLIAAPFTPMHKNGTLNPEKIKAYYQSLKRNGVKGVFINGSTGEGVSMTQDEKKITISAWADATKDDADFKVITLTGGTCLQEAIELAKYAQKENIYGFSLTAPYYFKAPDAGQLAKTCIEVGNAVPDFPFYYYHIPVLNGTPIPMIDLLKEIDGKVDNFLGIKYTHEDFMDFSSCLNFKDGKYDMLWGRDENMLPALAIGAKGAVGSTYNYAAPLYIDLINAFNEGNLKKARALQQKSIEMVGLLGKYGGIATGKYFMKLVDLDCGKFRLPVKNMTEQQFEAFKKDVEKIGFDEFKSE